MALQEDVRTNRILEKIVKLLHTKEKWIMKNWTTSTTMGDLEVIYHLTK